MGGEIITLASGIFFFITNVSQPPCGLTYIHLALFWNMPVNPHYTNLNFLQETTTDLSATHPSLRSVLISRSLASSLISAITVSALWKCLSRSLYIRLRTSSWRSAPGWTPYLLMVPFNCSSKYPTPPSPHLTSAVALSDFHPRLISHPFNWVI